MQKSVLRNYAKLIVNVGAAVKRGQQVLIQAEIEQPEFVNMVVDECYRAGASKVHVDWSYQPLVKSHVKYCKDDMLGTLEKWQLEKWEWQAEVLPCKIYLMSEDPDGLEKVNLKKYAKATAAKSKQIKPIRAKMENKYQWCIAAVPGKKWAKKVFPGERTSAAVEKLWDAILKTSRAYGDGIAAWDQHNADLKSRCDHLNSLNIRSLHFKASNGTDLKVGLIPGVVFMGGGENALGSGIYFNPNIPSEEVFTSPMKGEAEGIVYSSRPLCYNGALIDNFFVRFEGGKAVEVGAEKNEEMLREIISMDEGAAYLGECALVPYSSPIRESGLLFYNTLFDENAACHLALGRGFTNLVTGYENMSAEELRAVGINDSVVHEDFMIGTKDMSITGILEDGTEIAIFRDGEWAF